ncbi:SDR family NAD(P)-dependent oxidoreductase [Nonomuraea deserti]|uniref:SDR family NAD(P)-dependent oxidoreductase n=1 Tax=Nonomuraea deserti TaxID=1848322 RepID=A0A4R4VJJ5_9ACTN|nr:SDR family NAD(P)-dependent oxidoreductase [Nonomuraea deserti]TDD02414.1 SDR family NAD(P)-dependent oxidoreductase [Nonomuraea deserti]
MNITHAVVTGAAGGIGRALAAGLRAAGAHVVLADVDAAGLAAASAELEADAVPTDVADPAAMEALAAAAPGADLVCLNAGIVGQDLGTPWEASDDDWGRVFAVNVGGVRNGLRAFVPRLLAAGRPAHILVTASLAGLVTFPGGGAYAASKHAVVTLAEQAALALEGTPVGVTLLCPALVRTAMSPEGEDPAVIADAALAAVRDGRFVVTPDEWRAAVSHRGHRLASGARPEIPSPA